MAKPSCESLSSMNSSGKSVLLVGKDKTVSDFARMPVIGAGFDLLTFESAPEALGAPQAKDCSALVYVEQPDQMQGAEFISEFRTLNAAAKVVLIAKDWINSSDFADM